MSSVENIYLAFIVNALSYSYILSTYFAPFVEKVFV
jgi:hypothetical protein